MLVFVLLDAGGRGRSELNQVQDFLCVGNVHAGGDGKGAKVVWRWVWAYLGGWGKGVEIRRLWSGIRGSSRYGREENCVVLAISIGVRDITLG